MLAWAFVYSHIMLSQFQLWTACECIILQPSDKLSTLCLKKHPRQFLLYLKNQLSDFDNLWYKYSRHNLPSNDYSVSHLTQRLFLHYLGKAQPAKYHFFIQCDMIA